MKEELFMAEKEFIITGTDTIDGYELYNYCFWDVVDYKQENPRCLTSSTRILKKIEEIGKKYGYDAMVGLRIQDSIKTYGKINNIDFGVGGDGEIWPECFLRASGTFVNIRKKEK